MDNLEQCWEYNTAAPHEANMPLIDLTREEPTTSNTLNVLPNLSRKRKLPDCFPESSTIEMPSTDTYISPDAVNQLNAQLVNKLNAQLVNSRTSRMRLNPTMVRPNNTMPINHPLLATPLIRNVRSYRSNVALNSRTTYSFSTYNATRNTIANLRSSNVQGGTSNLFSFNSNDAQMLQRYANVQAEWDSELSLAARDARSRILSENMVVDHGMHDGHMDTPFDVDNISYEQLLELEGRIGDVNVVLSEEVIVKCQEIQMHFPSIDRVQNEVQTCCMCLEEYREGEIMVRLECGHDFHNTCMKKWHDFHNTCPICKPTRIDT